jgi:AIR synthase related protein, C-terminal domain
VNLQVLERAEVTVHDAAPWDSSVRLGEVLLAPTIIYANDVLAAMAEVPVHGAVHITGGGFTENLPRVMPDGCACAIDLASWEVPPLFRWLQAAGACRPADLRGPARARLPACLPACLPVQVPHLRDVSVTPAALLVAAHHLWRHTTILAATACPASATVMEGCFA